MVQQRDETMRGMRRGALLMGEREFVGQAMGLAINASFVELET